MKKKLAVDVKIRSAPDVIGWLFLSSFIKPPRSSQLPKCQFFSRNKNLTAVTDMTKQRMLEKKH